MRKTGGTAMKTAKKITALIISAAVMLSVLACGGVIAGAEDGKLVSAQIPGIESLSTIQLATVWRENINRVRTVTTEHSENSQKSVEITLGSPDGTTEYKSFSVASVTAADKTLAGFDTNAHEFPKGAEIFGDISLEGAVKLSLWVGNYPSAGKVRLQLLTAPCSGPLSSNQSYAAYPKGFLFSSAEASPVDGVVTFALDDFEPATWWTNGTVYDHLAEINAVKLIFTPGAGNSAYNTKYYFGDLRVWRESADYSWNAARGYARGVLEFTATAASADAKLSVLVDRKSIAPRAESYFNSYGELCADFAIDTAQYPDGTKKISLLDGEKAVLSADIIFDNTEPYINIFGEEMTYYVDKTQDGAVLTVPAVVSGNGNENKLYHADILNVAASENRTTINAMKSRDPEGETPLAVSESGCTSTVSNDTSVPYQAFEIDTAGANGDVLISYKGSTVKNERLIMELFVPSEGRWETVAEGCDSGEDSVFTVSASTQKYADENGKIKARVSEYLYGNGSDTMAWTTDTQYYIGTQSLLHYMTTQFDHLVNEYGKGNIAYVCNTGDVVDGKGSQSQYKLAAQVHDKLDLAGVPNGVTPGNHDVGNANSDEWYYELWNKYFGAERYSHQPWWGGGYLGNTSHYDLLTIGGHDFIFLYLGLNNETTPEGIAWANGVLKAYKHRTAVILTHQFLYTTGSLMGGNDGFAPQIIEKIIEPNPNVRMVLCGHEPSSRNKTQKMKNGVTVLEILHDYQFDEDWSYREGGRGYFRYMTFGEDTVTSRAYSADYPEIDHFYKDTSELVENFTMDIDYVASDRQINTAYFTAVAVGEEFADVTVEKNGEMWTTAVDCELNGTNAFIVASTGADGNTVYSAAYPLIEKPSPFVLKGDMDGDGEITVTDALMALRIAAKLAPETPEAIAIGDTDGDSAITVTDALAILRVAAKLAPSL